MRFKIFHAELNSIRTEVGKGTIEGGKLTVELNEHAGDSLQEQVAVIEREGVIPPNRYLGWLMHKIEVIEE